jgi:NhaP-type Na+/H+ or K+/H+ antiporter
MTESITALLALIGIVVLVSSLLSGVVERTGLPQVAIFLLLGVVLGPIGLGLIELTLQSPAVQILSTLALLLVLFSDAIAVDVGELRANRRLALFALGPGTVLPALGITLAARLLLDLTIPQALILGASLASTDPVLLRGLVRRAELPGRARVALRLEGGMNDVVLLPIVVLSMLALDPARNEPAVVARHLLGLFALGPALGAIVGWVAITMLEQIRKRAGVRRDYESLYALGVAFTAFAAAESVGGSGYLAAFAAGLVIAALDVELCDCFLDYGEASAEMFLLLTFVAFGASLIWIGISVADFRTIGFALVALGARTAVLLPTLRQAGLDPESRRLIAWFGPRGLSSLLLVLLPVFAGYAGADRLFAIVALVVLLSVALHGGGIALFLQRRRAAGAGELANAPAAAPAARSPTATKAAPDERITIDELRALWTAGEAVIVADARTERSFGQDGSMAASAVRLPPDDAVRSARALGLSQHATVVVYCA